MKVLVSIGRLAVIALLVLPIGGCDCLVNTNDSLKSAFGPGQAPASYRVGPARSEIEVGSRVRIIREADVESGWSGSTTQPAVTPPPSDAPAPATQPGG